MVAHLPRQPARREHCRRLPVAGLRVIPAIAFAALCCAIGSPNAFGDLDECDFPVTSDVGNRQGQTKDEAKEELVRELAMKLRQFDRCLDRQRTAAATAVGDAASQAAEGGRTGVASSGHGGQNPGNGAERRSPGGGAPEQAGDPIAAVGDEAGSGRNGQSRGFPAGPPSSDRVAGAAGGARAAGSGMPGGSARVPDNVVEDDVARILREAAERETDPTRRAALWKEYENYVKNL